MALTIEATYENGVLKPVQPLPFVQEGTRIWVTLHTSAEEDRVQKAYGLLGWLWLAVALPVRFGAFDASPSCCRSPKGMFSTAGEPILQLETVGRGGICGGVVTAEWLIVREAARSVNAGSRREEEVCRWPTMEGGSTGGERESTQRQRRRRGREST